MPQPQKKKQYPGFFVTLEGTEGVGKSTLIGNLSALLTQAQCSVTLTREPGGSPLAEKIRSLVLDHAMCPEAELMLYEAARAEHVAAKILPALRRGDIVLCDRYTDSTLAYQGQARGLDWKMIGTLNRIATQGLKPDLTIWLDMDPAKGLARAKDPNRFEAEGVLFQKKVRAGYAKSYRESPQHWLRIPVERYTPEALAELVCGKITGKWPAKKRIKRKSGKNGK